MSEAAQRFDAVVIGAGFSGIHMLKSLRDYLGLKVRVYEAGETLGGTWYWNRYPGARCDSDTYIYCFTWDKQLFLSAISRSGWRVESTAQKNFPPWQARCKLSWQAG